MRNFKLEYECVCMCLGGGGELGERNHVSSAFYVKSSFSAFRVLLQIIFNIIVSGNT